MKSVDPDVRSGDPMSLKTIPDADGDACQSEWREWRCLTMFFLAGG